MKPWLRYLLYLVSLALTLALGIPSVLAKNNCETNLVQVNPAAGIGGTGSKITESGVGGTGIHASGGIGGTGHPEKGIGGTGSKLAEEGGIGGTGIIGTITGFASICVNGVEVHYDNNTPVTVDGRLTSVRELAVGQVVVTRALGFGQEVTAKHIAVVHAAVGPISHINHQTGEMHVLGQVVRATESRDLSHLKVGDWTQISGHRLANGTIMASRIETNPTSLEARINGHVTHVDAKGYEIHGARIQHDFKSNPANIAKGMEISVAGHWNGTNLQAQHVQIEPTRQAIGQANHLVIEGYVHALRGKEISIANQSITLDAKVQMAGDNKEDLRLNQRVLVSGRVGTDQRVIADRVELKSESPTQIQERIDRDQSNTGNRGKIAQPEEKAESRSNSGSDKDQSNKSDHEKETEKRESSGNSGKQTTSSDTQPRSDNSGSSGKDERQKTDHSKSPTNLSDQSKHDQKSPSSNQDSHKSDSANSSGRIDKDKLEKSIEEKPSSQSDKSDREIRLDHPSDLSKQEREQLESRDLDSDSKMVSEQMPIESPQILDQPGRSTISDQDPVERPEHPRDNDSIERPGNDLDGIRDTSPERVPSPEILERPENLRESADMLDRSTHHLNEIRDSMPDRIRD